MCLMHAIVIDTSHLEGGITSVLDWRVNVLSFLHRGIVLVKALVRILNDKRVHH